MKKYLFGPVSLDLSRYLLFFPNRIRILKKLFFDSDDIKLQVEIKKAEGGKCLKRGVNLPFLKTDQAINL